MELSCELGFPIWASADERRRQFCAGCRGLELGETFFYRPSPETMTSTVFTATTRIIPDEWLIGKDKLRSSRMYRSPKGGSPKEAKRGHKPFFTAADLFELARRMGEKGL
jgi:hypothetical protein